MPTEVQTVKMLLEEKSDQGLHNLPVPVYPKLQTIMSGILYLKFSFGICDLR